MFHTVMFISEARISAGQRPFVTAKDSPRSRMISHSITSAVDNTPVRKVSTGSSRSAMANIGQLVPQTSVSAASSASTLIGTRGTSGLRLVLVGRLEEAAVDAPAAVGQPRHRIEGGDRPAVGPDHIDLLRRLAVEVDDFAEVEGARAIDRLVALAHHVHEDLGAAEHALDAGRGEAEGGRAVVAAERLDLAADDVADRAAVGVAQPRFLRRRGGAAEREGEDQQGEDAGGHAASLAENRRIWPACNAGAASLGCAPSPDPLPGRPATRP